MLKGIDEKENIEKTTRGNHRQERSKSKENTLHCELPRRKRRRFTKSRVRKNTTNKDRTGLLSLSFRTGDAERRTRTCFQKKLGTNQKEVE